MGVSGKKLKASPPLPTSPPPTNPPPCFVFVRLHWIMSRFLCRTYFPLFLSFLVVPILLYVRISSTVPQRRQSGWLSLQQCCGSGSGIRCLFDPWIRDRFFLDRVPEPGSRIPDPKQVFLRANYIFLDKKSSIILCKLAQICLFTSLKIRLF